MQRRTKWRVFVTSLAVPPMQGQDTMQDTRQAERRRRGVQQYRTRAES